MSQIPHSRTTLDSGRTAIDRDYLFPASYTSTPFAALCQTAFAAMADLMPDGNLPRVPGWTGPAGYPAVLDRYGRLPAGPAADMPGLVADMSRDLMAGTTIWRSPDLQYNIGAAPNVVAAAMYALALDLNVYLISDGQAGHAVLAERAVSSILADLSMVDRETARGVFTFGGTGTMAYAIKAGIRRCAPESPHAGTPSDVHVMVTEDAHFSHATAADWLGIGADRLLVAPVSPLDRRTDLVAAEQMLRACLDSGGRIATILLNGGTTYDHAIDDIAAFADLRDRLVTEYRLVYRPLLHVDSVIGWSWLFYAGFDFTAGDLDIPEPAMAMLAEQYARIAAVDLADSWGLDFHKGVGGCPATTSFIQFNDKRDLGLLRKGAASGTASLHQLAEEFSDLSPVDYTLETSRSGGMAVAALAALHSLGAAGHRQVLADLVAGAHTFRDLIEAAPGMTVLNPHALGFQTMVRLQPPGACYNAAAELHDTGQDATKRVQAGNDYLKGFVTWDNARMNSNGGGVVYSFSSRYVTTNSGVPISGLKFYPTNPHIDANRMREATATLTALKADYDRSHWQAS